MRYVAVSALALLLAACPATRKDVPCVDTSDCNQFGGGSCDLNAPTGTTWCSYPDTACPNGRRWGNADIGDGLEGLCQGADAPPDAALDASTIVDASMPDATVIPPDAPGGPTTGMIKIPAGAFWRGCNPANPNPYACTSVQLERESPYRQITLKEFWIDKYEVTQESYAACITANGCTTPAPVDPQNAPDAGYDPGNKPDHPVSNVTWAQARAYCMWLGKRLPTEAEWEKAARGTDGRMYPWGDTAPTDCIEANVGICTGSGTHAVGSHPAGDSPYGVADMAGNVSEIVADFYDVTYYASAPATDPTGPASGSERVVRGAAYLNSSTGARTAWRANAGAANVTDYARGFRCAYSP